MTIDLTLRDKGSLVQGLWDAVNRGSGSIANVAPLIRRVLETGAWRERIHDGERLTNETFLEFVTASPLRGCGWPPDKVEALIKDDPETLAMWRKATTGQQGAHNDNIIMKSEQGTSRAYILDRLKRERPDLFQRVVAKELSPNAAAIEAGFRTKMLSIPVDLPAAARAIVRHFGDDQALNLVNAIHAVVSEHVEEMRQEAKGYRQEAESYRQEADRYKRKATRREH